MRTITEINLKNFQIHENLSFKLTRGVNVICGTSDTGKSCIIRALRWILYNDILGDCIRRMVNGEFTKQTSVEITFDDGTKLQRIKSNSINAYVLKEINKEEKRFNSVGREIPQEVKELLGTTILEVDKEKIILNVQEQLTSHFLLVGEGLGSFRAKIVNKLSGDEILDNLLVEYNKDLLKISRELPQLEEDVTNKEESVKKMTEELVKIQEVYNQAETLFKSIEENEGRLTQIKGLQVKKQALLTEKQGLEKTLKTLPIKYPDLSDLKKKIELLNQLIEIQENYQSLQGEKQLLEIEKEKIVINLPVTQQIKEKVDLLDKLFNLVISKKQNIINLVENQELRRKNTRNLIELENQRKELLKSLKVCPLCFQEIK